MLGFGQTEETGRWARKIIYLLDCLDLPALNNGENRLTVGRRRTW